MSCKLNKLLWSFRMLFIASTLLTMEDMKMRKYKFFHEIRSHGKRELGVELARPLVPSPFLDILYMPLYSHMCVCFQTILS